MDYLHIATAGLLGLIAQFGLGVGLIIACLAGAWLSPIFKKDFVWAAIVIAAITATFSIGVLSGERRTQAQWDAASEVALQNAKQARVDAVRTVHRKPSRWLPNHADGYDRDGR